jgi:hypothetical protein
MRGRMKPVMFADAQAMRRARMQIIRLLVAVCFILLGLTVPAAAQAGKRLILKDGSWQEIMKYEVTGDRTRYFSTQRREWEEVPSDLVNWKATVEWNARPFQMPPDEEEGRSGSEIDATEKLTVAPGIQLPTSGGVFILDTFSGQPSLVELIQVPGALNHDTAGIFHSAINAGGSFQQRLELRRSHARTQAHILLPQLFVKIAESDQARQIASADRFRIVRLEPKKDSRILASVNVTITGKQSEAQNFVPARVDSFSEGWLKVIPLEDLQPGEYALVEMLDRSQFNSYAWDFGVDPHAPGNLNSREADWAPPTDEKSTFSPELKAHDK